ncbi:hypothetical protein THF5H11_70131 [Vibrio jasicida]|uniref:Uncharacterized protein n=1 Tax=Vibrio jasicida TaxID=766224 RepID=A0AAU9QHK9_9VIBR|nr:hypothetical protein THF5H11_70131 [Vibrio jasicida]CAH1561659.1 hypothetical protein THF1C08_120047 [Vibrio jasicida]CAH1571483.1 hypothetical protein THF1A12_110118 [Vibrio jasicida]CAH1605550.1 hypothetical protein THF5G08_150026 [Vibrio jasicida]
MVDFSVPWRRQTDSSFEHFILLSEAGYKYTTKKFNYKHFSDRNHKTLIN